MTEKRFQPYAYLPTASRSGDAAPSVFRGANGFIRGLGEQTFFESYGGSLDLNETIPADAISGTIAFSPSSREVTGTSTEFFNELHRGQMLVTPAGEVLVVEEVTSKTKFTAYELPRTTASGQTAYRMPVLFELDKSRGTLLSGNALESDKGTILSVGSGTLRRNGSALTSSLAASRQAKIALYDAGTGNYTVQELGFSSVPVGVTAAPSTAPASKAFADADVNTGTDTVTIAAHGFNNGQKVTLSNTGGALPVTNPAGAFTGKEVFIIKTGVNTFKFAATLAGTVGTPVPIDISTAAGGGTHTITPVTKAMPAGDRSIRVSKASTKLGVPSYGNPCEKIKVTITAGQGIAVTFPAMDSNTDATNPHDAWRIDATLFGGSTTQATANADSGPWYFAVTVSSEDLGGTSGGTYYLEYLDAELSAGAILTSFDNDKPKRAEFIGSLAGAPVLVSAGGKGTTDYPEEDAPGSLIVPFKLGNLAAAPSVFDSGLRNEVPLSPPEVIIGLYMAAGRLYLMCANTLQIAAYTENPAAPVSTRPFWKSGFKNPYALCFANDRLYGFTNAPIRSPEDGSDSSIDRSFGEKIKEIFYNWNASRVFVQHDPQNECVAYFYSAAYKNASNYWVSVVYPFMYGFDEWSPPIVLSSTTRDSIVCGAATVAGHLEFLMGGRKSGGGFEVKTYRFDGGISGGETVPWYLAFQYQDGGSEKRPKKIKFPRVTGKGKGRTIGIHGAEAGETIDVAALEAGNSGSKTGAISLPDQTAVSVGEILQVEAAGLQVYTLRIDGVYDGAETDAYGFPVKDRVDEIAFEEIVQGGRR